MKEPSYIRRNRPGRASFTDSSLVSPKKYSVNPKRGSVNLSATFGTGDERTKSNQLFTQGNNSSDPFFIKSLVFEKRSKDPPSSSTREEDVTVSKSPQKRRIDSEWIPNISEKMNYQATNQENKRGKGVEDRSMKGTEKYNRLLANIQRKRRIITELQEIANTPLLSSQQPHGAERGEMKIDLKNILSKKEGSASDRHNQQKGTFGKESFRKIKNGFYTHRESAKDPSRTAQEDTCYFKTTRAHPSLQSQTLIPHRAESPIKTSHNFPMCQMLLSEPEELSRKCQVVGSVGLDRRLANGARRITQVSSYFESRKVRGSDFEVGQKLGEGKFGIVYAALHRSTGVLYALKKIRKDVVKPMMEQFIREVKIQMYCNHPLIVKLFSLFSDQTHFYLVLEYMQSGHLFSRLKRTGKIETNEVASYVKDVTDGVDYLHSHGIAHRDIKPENIVLSNGVAKICDFGWAVMCDSRRQTYCGTFDYLSPEMLKGDQYGTSIDLWSLGVLTYELLVGHAPFYHPSRKQTMKKIMASGVETAAFPPDIPADAKDFVYRLLQQVPAKRMKTGDILNHFFLRRVNSSQL